MRRGRAPHSCDRDAEACSVVEFSGGGKGPTGSVVVGACIGGGARRVPMEPVVLLLQMSAGHVLSRP
jgi:hypothetical protein